MTQNSSINLSVVNNADGFSLSGNGAGAAGRAISITSGNVTMVAGTTILNGQLLIGNSDSNSYDQGNMIAGSGIAIQSGAGSLTCHSSYAYLSGTIKTPSGYCSADGTSGITTTINYLQSSGVSGVITVKNGLITMVTIL